MPAPSGQTGIRLREALAAGDGGMAAELLPLLDRAHRIEILLGAALRDGREDFAAARELARLETAGAGLGDWTPVCHRLATGTPDRRLDDLAAGWIASRAAPDRWDPRGRALSGDEAGLLASADEPDAAVVALLDAGVSGLALLEAFRGHALHAAVSVYYRQGTIHALGPRPLLVLALSGR